ncbi:MAG: hypothetical protein MUC35_03505 [Candidatus Margulisbacteria bacterium]|jgi:hypothetical protein|nr:hypothetical protein [Candidatus Margulisiibacteriota bacterium]
MKRTSSLLIACFLLTAYCIVITLAGCGRDFDLKKPNTQSQVAGAVIVAAGAAALYAVAQKPAAPYYPPVTTTITSTTTTRGLVTTTTDPSVSTTTTTLGPPWDLVTAAAAFPSREGHAVVAFDDGSGEKMWLLGGVDSVRTPNVHYRDVWSSTDGVTWTLATAEANFTSRESFACVVADLGSGRRLWVIGGNDATTSYGDVWSSTNGISWECATTEAQFGPRDGHTAVLHNSRLWVIAGEDAPNSSSSGLNSDVWSSSDGAVWTQEASATSFGIRYRHSSTPFNGKMWVAGGWSGVDDRRDAWSSTDGLSWSEATEPPFFAREGFSLLTSNGGTKLWVLGGQGFAYFQDAWYSTDGNNWTMQTNNIFNGKPRNRLAAVDYNGKIWAIGGYDGHVYNDVWSYTP